MPIVEIGVASFTLGRDRVQEGDIIAAREPSRHHGEIEDRFILWMNMDTDRPIDTLIQPLYDQAGREIRGKRQYWMDLNDLVRDEGIDKERVNDPNDVYQPLQSQEIKGRNQEQEKPRPPSR